MPPALSFRSRTTSDADKIEKSRKIAEELSESPEQCEITIYFSDTERRGLVAACTFDLTDIENQPLVSHAIEHDGEALWAEVLTNFKSKNLSLKVGRNLDVESSTIDEEITVKFTKKKESLVPDDYLETSKAFSSIQKHFVPYSHPEAIEQVLGPELTEYYSRREEGLSHLENLAQRITKETHEYRLKLDSETEQHKRDLDQSYRFKQSKLQEEYDEKASELNAHKEELEKKKKELDDRTARHARRETSKALQEKIADRSKRFTLTPDTQRKRQPIRFLFAVLLAVTGGLVVQSLSVPAKAVDGIAMWFEMMRLPLGTLGFVFTAIFFIRWEDHWFRQHADEEFRLHKLALDVDRAGYATEMLLEWQEDKGGEMPAVLVDRLTTGLFTDQTQSEQVQHPTEDITDKLLKIASRLDIDVPGLKMSVPGRKVRKLNKT